MVTNNEFYFDASPIGVFALIIIFGITMYVAFAESDKTRQQREKTKQKQLEVFKTLATTIVYKKVTKKKPGWFQSDEVTEEVQTTLLEKLGEHRLMMIIEASTDKNGHVDEAAAKKLAIKG